MFGFNELIMAYLSKLQFVKLSENVFFTRGLRQSEDRIKNGSIG